jgi:serine protease Do
MVIAIGNPLGMNFAGTVTSGVVSAVNREVTSNDGTQYVLIQTDAAINSGNSGGALINMNGEVIGVNTMKISSTGIEGMGFSIPINQAKPIIEQLIQNQEVVRPTIGITGVNVTQDAADSYGMVVGIMVKSVGTGSAAEKAGIKTGDIITAFNGTKVETIEELTRLKNQMKIGDTVEMAVSRQGSEVMLQVTLQAP